MRWGIIEQHWKQFERMFNYRWKLLTKDDLRDVDGNRAILNDKLQEHYGLTRAESNKQINKFLSTFQGILKGNIHFPRNK